MVYIYLGDATPKITRSQPNSVNYPISQQYSVAQSGIFALLLDIFHGLLRSGTCFLDESTKSSPRKACGKQHILLLFPNEVLHPQQCSSFP